MSYDFSPPPTQQSTGTNFFTKRRYLGTSSFLSSVMRSRHCGQAEPLSTDACEAPSGLGSPGLSQLCSAGSGVCLREQSLQFHLKMWLGEEGVAGVALKQHQLPGQGGCKLSLWIEALGLDSPSRDGFDFYPEMFSCKLYSLQPWERCQISAPHLPLGRQQSGPHLLLLSGSANPSLHHGTASIGRAERLPTAWEGTGGFEYPLGEGGPKPKFDRF